MVLVWPFWALARAVSSFLRERWGADVEVSGRYLHLFSGGVSGELLLPSSRVGPVNWSRRFLHWFRASVASTFGHFLAHVVERESRRPRAHCLHISKQLFRRDFVLPSSARARLSGGTLLLPTRRVAELVNQL